MWKINECHFERFVRSDPGKVYAVGAVPRRWALMVSGQLMDRMSYKALTCEELTNVAAPDSGFTDEEVFCSVLAWSGLCASFGKAAWLRLGVIEPVIGALRRDGLSRKRGYYELGKLFSEVKRSGVGPACYSMLVRFCGQKNRGYIMDYWASQSINLLFSSDENVSRNPVVFNGRQVSPRNSAEDYERYCCLVESLAERMGGVAATEVEQRLMAGGAKSGRKRGEWRQYVMNHSARLSQDKLGQVEAADPRQALLTV